MKKEVLERVKRKIKTIIGRNIPRYSFYRPKGIYYTSKDFINSVAGKEPSSAYVEVYPKLVSTLDLDEAFFNLCLTDFEKLNFKLNRIAETTYLITAIQNGRIYTDHFSTNAIISQDNQLIADVSFSYDKDRVVEPEKNYIFLQKYFKKPTIYKGVIFSMLSGQGAINNYGHWLIDALPRLHLLKRSGWFDKVDWFLVPNYTYDYQKDSLKLLGIDESKIIRGDQPLHIQADVLIASTAPRGNGLILPFWVGEFLRNTFLPQHILKSNYPPFIYISRRDTTIRKVTNEDEVITLVEQYGFQPFELSKLPFIEKVKLFASAQVIVSAAGAAMVNILFSKKGAKVIEIFAEGNLHPETYDKANKVGLEYHYIIIHQNKRPTSTHQSLHQGFTVDIAALKQKLDSILQDKRT